MWHSNLCEPVCNFCSGRYINNLKKNPPILRPTKIWDQRELLNSSYACWGMGLRGLDVSGPGCCYLTSCASRLSLPCSFAFQHTVNTPRGWMVGCFSSSLPFPMFDHCRLRTQSEHAVWGLGETGSPLQSGDSVQVKGLFSGQLYCLSDLSASIP